MLKKRLFWLIMAAMAVLVGYTIYSGRQAVRSFTDELTDYRRGRQDFLQNNEASPLTDRQQFSGLAFFAPAEHWQISSHFTPESGARTFAVQLTDGKTETYTLAGRAEFEAGGRPQQLLVFESPESGQYFVPFRDATSGKSTYGGGRYLDVPTENLTGSRLLLDFNRAYNPYCAYTPDYVCPVPPRENTLTVAVEAGEKTYPGAH